MRRRTVLPALAALSVAVLPAYADPQSNLAFSAEDVHCAAPTACVHFAAEAYAVFRAGMEGAPQDTELACVATAPGADSVTINCDVEGVPAPEQTRGGPVAETVLLTDLEQTYQVTICYSAIAIFPARLGGLVQTPVLCSEHSMTIGGM